LAVIPHDIMEARYSQFTQSPGPLFIARVNIQRSQQNELSEASLCGKVMWKGRTSVHESSREVVLIKEFSGASADFMTAVCLHPIQDGKRICMHTTRSAGFISELAHHHGEDFWKMQKRKVKYLFTA
jgi:hypothetical protein